MAAAPRYLLDTSILSMLVRDPAGVIAERIAKVGEANVCTSIIVACELRFGAAKRALPRLTRQVDAVLSAMEVLPLDDGVDDHYGEIRATLERNGTPIGANDMLIAAHARAIGAVCVSANVSEFRRVPKLKVENWLA
jgi:tRNA(fMet)-specific endonuclease VapC